MTDNTTDDNGNLPTEEPEAEDEESTREDKNPETEFEEESEETLYAGFNQRLMAMGLDIFWVYVLVIPVLRIFTDMFFGVLDTREGVALVQQLGQAVNSTEMSVQQAVQQFVNSEYAYRWFVENIFQVFIIGAAVVPFWVYYGASPGMWLFNIRVEDAKTGSNPGWVQSVLRFAMCIVSFAPLMLGFVWMLFNKRRQSWHDIVSHTVVVRRKWQWKRWMS